MSPPVSANTSLASSSLSRPQGIPVVTGHVDVRSDVQCYPSAVWWERSSGRAAGDDSESVASGSTTCSACSDEVVLVAEWNIEDLQLPPLKVLSAAIGTCAYQVACLCTALLVLGPNALDQPAMDSPSRAQCLYLQMHVTPQRLTTVWLMVVLAGDPPWLALVPLAVSTLAFQLDCEQGTWHGLLAPVSYLPLILVLGATLGFRRERRFLFSLVLWELLFLTGYGVYIRCARCMLDNSPKGMAVAVRLLVPFYETLARHTWSWLWRASHGGPCEVLFFGGICQNVIIAEILQMASFLSVLQSPRPARSAAELAVLSVAVDFISRAKVLQMMWWALSGQQGRKFRINDAADMALRARWLYPYTVIASFMWAAAHWHLTEVRVHHGMYALGALYFSVELVSDLVFLAYQACLRTHGLGMLELLSDLQRPYGHRFPYGFCDCAHAARSKRRRRLSTWSTPDEQSETQTGPQRGPSSWRCCGNDESCSCSRPASKGCVGTRFIVAVHVASMTIAMSSMSLAGLLHPKCFRNSRMASVA